MYAERSLCCEHERADIKRGLRLRRNPVCLHLYQRFYRFYEHIHRELRHAESRVGIDHSLRIHLRTEQLDLSLCRAVCLHTLKCLLRIVQRHTGRLQTDRSFRHDSRILPAVFLRPVHDEHVIGHILAESEMFLIRFLL